MKITHNQLRKLIKEELSLFLENETDGDIPKNVFTMPLMIMNILPTSTGNIVVATGLGGNSASSVVELTNRVKSASSSGGYQNIDDLKLIAELPSSGGFFVFRVPSGKASKMFIKRGPHVAKGGLAGFIDVDTSEIEDIHGGSGVEYISATHPEFSSLFDKATDSSSAPPWTRLVKVDPSDVDEISQFMDQLPYIDQGIPTPTNWIRYNEPTFADVKEKD